MLGMFINQAQGVFMATEQLYPFSVYYLRITLENSKPVIWRDILVPSDLSLEALHYVIQTVMGWENSHAHQFIAEKVLYSNDTDRNNVEDEYCL
jgi:Plasmid pRiA4b ORF-3-like protein